MLYPLIGFKGHNICMVLRQHHIHICLTLPLFIEVSVLQARKVIG